MANATRNTDFRALGKHGIQFAMIGDELVLKVPVHAKARKEAPRAAGGTGKNMLLANSGGWTSIPGTDLGLNLNVGFPVPPTA